MEKELPKWFNLGSDTQMWQNVLSLDASHDGKKITEWCNSYSFNFFKTGDIVKNLDIY